MIVGLTGLGLRFNKVANGAHLGRRNRRSRPRAGVASDERVTGRDRQVKAVRYYGRKDIRVETVKEPKDFGPDQLLVKPLWTGICGTDLHEYIAGARR